MNVFVTGFLVFFSVVCFSQRGERITVQGKVIVTNDQDKELVNIYNTSSERGTATDAEGNFTLDVALNDRISITAIQFQTFTVIIDEDIIKNKMMRIYLNPYVNKLDEVFLSNHTLSGILEYDAENIAVIAAPKIELSFDADADFAPDRFSRIEGNVAEEAMGIKYMTNGLNIKALAGLIAKAIFPKKKKDTYIDPSLKEVNVVLALQEKYTAAFYSKTFNIPLDRVDAFIYFAEENAITPTLLHPENEFELLEILFQQSEIYKTRTTDE